MMRWRLIVLSALWLATQIAPGAAALVAAETVNRVGDSSAQAVGPVKIDMDGELPKFLSAYNLFLDARRQIPNDGVVPYDLNTPHFADYATLHRFVWMPKGRSCKYGPEGELEYPLGSAIIITVGYANDLRDREQGEKIVETRLWIRKPAGWVGAQYVWNDDMTEAELSVVGEQVDVSWIHTDGQIREHTFRVPNQNQCLQCHEIDNELIPLGPVHARYLNKNFAYEHGQQNQLEYWSQVGYLSGLPDNRDQIPSVPVWNNPETGSLDARARAYLDMNCSSCHRPGGIAFTSGLDLRYEQDVPVRFGIFKAPVAAGRSAGNARFVIKPGNPEKSILILRLRSTDPGIRMPIVGRGLMHEEGVELIQKWISEMQYPEMTASQDKLDQRMEARRTKFKSSPLTSKQ
jgi:uncharacterized repeat protein (TIGR03806 family)